MKRSTISALMGLEECSLSGVGMEWYQQACDSTDSEEMARFAEGTLHPGEYFIIDVVCGEKLTEADCPGYVDRLIGAGLDPTQFGHVIDPGDEEGAHLYIFKKK